MPRKKNTHVVLEDEQEKEGVLEGGESDIEDALRSVPGGVTTVKLYRVLPQGGRPKFLTELAPEEFSEANVKEMYGGGSYKIRARKGDGKWGASMFDIEGNPKKVPSEVFEEEEEAEPQPRHIPHAPIMQQVQPASSGLDPIAMLQLIQQAEERGQDRMLKLMEFMRPQQQPPDVTKQVFEIVEKIAPMMGGDGGSPWLAALSQFREPIMKIVDTLHTSLSRPVTMPPVSPQVRASVQPHVHPNPQPPKEDEMLLSLVKQSLPVLINAAAKNADPEFYAGVILDQLPESGYDDLARWISQPNCLESLAALEPGIRFQQEWWQSLRVALIGAISDARTNIQPHTTSTDELSETE